MKRLLAVVSVLLFLVASGSALAKDWSKVRIGVEGAYPPFSYSWEANETMGEGFRFKNYALAPKSAAVFAFFLHGFHFQPAQAVPDLFQ